MGIVVRSPYSGQPVKIRDQDVGRAVRDEENRIFYALPRSDGSGYYGAPTRAGGPKDEAKAAELEAKVHHMKANAQEQQAAVKPAQGVHDATGRPRRSAGRLVLVVVLLIAAGLGGAYALGYLDGVIQQIQEQLGGDGTSLPSGPVDVVPGVTPDDLPGDEGVPGVRGEPGVPASRAWHAGPLQEQVRLPYRYLTQLSPVAEPRVVFDVDAVGQVDQVSAESQSGVVASDVVGDAGDTAVQPVLPREAAAAAPAVVSASPVPELETGRRIDVADLTDASAASAAAAKPDKPFHRLAGGVEARVDKLGAGVPIEAGEAAVVHYVGVLPDGTVFDSSIERDQPLSFHVGTGSVIRGWDIGIAGMRPGERRTLRVPAHLAYGSRGVPGLIPANADLVFEVTLLGRDR